MTPTCLTIEQNGNIKPFGRNKIVNCCLEYLNYHQGRYFQREDL